VKENKLTDLTAVASLSAEKPTELAAVLLSRCNPSQRKGEQADRIHGRDASFGSSSVSGDVVAVAPLSAAATHTVATLVVALSRTSFFVVVG